MSPPLFFLTPDPKFPGNLGFDAMPDTLASVQKFPGNFGIDAMANTYSSF